MSEKLAKNSSLTSQALGGVLKEAKLPSHGVRELKGEDLRRKHTLEPETMEKASDFLEAS